MKYLVEDSKNKILSQARSGEQYKSKPGENRYSRRVKSKISSTTKTYNEIDMDKFFNKDILDVKIPVNGENHNGHSNEYLVTISFSGILQSLQSSLTPGQPLDYRDVMKALRDAFNRQDIMLKCTCPDWKYRIGYWASMKDIQAGEKEKIPSKITNPEDKLGHACKHACLVLSQQSWTSKVARVIMNYVKYFEAHYPKKYKSIIFPQLYGMPWEKAQLETDKQTIDISNEEGRKRGQFKKGNTMGVRFAKKADDTNEDNQEQSTDIENNDDEN